MGKNIGKNISKNLSGKYRKKTEATSNLIANKIADRITKVSRTSPQNSSETVESEAENIGFDRVIPKERYISPEKDRKLSMI